MLCVDLKHPRKMLVKNIGYRGIVKYNVVRLLNKYIGSLISSVYIVPI